MSQLTGIVRRIIAPKASPPAGIASNELEAASAESTIITQDGAMLTRSRGSRIFSRRDITKVLTYSSRAKLESLIKQTSRYEYLGNNEGIATILGKYMIYVNTLDPAISPHLIMSGFWEMWNTMFFANLVKPGMSVVEIGANLGYFTLLLSDLVGATGSVVAYEPFSLNYHLLSKSVQLNGFSSRTKCVRAAMSDQNGSATIHVDPINYGGGSIMRSGQSDGTISEEVVTHTFDSQFAGKKVDVIKIDVEGAEQVVVNGMQRFLEAKSPATIVLEFDPARFADWQNWLGNLVSLGFSLGIVEYDGSMRPVGSIASLASCGLSELVLHR